MQARKCTIGNFSQSKQVNFDIRRAQNQHDKVLGGNNFAQDLFKLLHCAIHHGEI